MTSAEKEAAIKAIATQISGEPSFIAWGNDDNGMLMLWVLSAHRTRALKAESWAREGLLDAMLDCHGRAADGKRALYNWDETSAKASSGDRMTNTDQSSSIIDVCQQIHGSVTGSGDLLSDESLTLLADWLERRIGTGWSKSTFKHYAGYDTAVRGLAVTAIAEARAELQQRAATPASLIERTRTFLELPKTDPRRAIVEFDTLAGQLADALEAALARSVEE